MSKASERDLGLQVKGVNLIPVTHFIARKQYAIDYQGNFVCLLT